MDNGVFMILLFTVPLPQPLSSGGSMPSANTDTPSSVPNVYYFIRHEMNWDDAHAYCIREHTAMAQIYSKQNVKEMMNTAPEGYTDKAWIGQYENISEWTWADGQPASYFNWRPGVFLDPVESCVMLDNNGHWNSVNCSTKRRFVCYDGDGYTARKTRLTWNDAKTDCEKSGDILAVILDGKENSRVQNSTFSGLGKVWIGLHRTRLWYWSEPGEISAFTNWQEGQPDNVNGPIGCGAAQLTDGTWTDEQCNATYPFFCSGIHKAHKTVVKMKLKSNKNLEDPVYSAELLRQIHTALGNQGVTDFKLTWKKQPMKQESRETKDAC